MLGRERKGDRKERGTGSLIDVGYSCSLTAAVIGRNFSAGKSATESEPVPLSRSFLAYHQWLSSQYGLKKLVEHIWKLIGIAGTCHSLSELKRKMAEVHGKIPVQYTLFVDMD